MRKDDEDYLAVSKAIKEQFSVMFFGAIPASIVGFYTGCFASGIFHAPELHAVLIRALACAIPPAILAWCFPRFWILPSCIYGFTFAIGYSIRNFGADLGRMLGALPLTLLTLRPLGQLPEHNDDELPWLLLFAAWLACFIAFLRSRRKTVRE